MMKRSEILRFILVGLVLFLGGCVLKQNPIEINHYTIDFKIKEINSKPSTKTIFIEEPVVNKSFNLTSIFYNTKPYLFEEYAENRWINLPSNMIYNQLIDSFSSSKIFSSVVSRDFKIKKEYVLKTEVVKLYHGFEGDKSYSIIKIKFDLVEDNKILKSFDYDKKVLAKENNAYGYVKATNEGLKEILEDLLTKSLLFSL